MHAEGRGRGGERKRERKDACWWRGKIAPLKETVAKQSHNASRIINIPYRQRSKLNLSTLSRTRKSKSLPFLFPKIKDFSRNYNRNRYLTAASIEIYYWLETSWHPLIFFSLIFANFWLKKASRNNRINRYQEYRFSLFPIRIHGYLDRVTLSSRHSNKGGTAISR